MSTVNAYANEVETVKVPTKEAATYDFTRTASEIFDNTVVDLIIFSSSAVTVCIILFALIIMFNKNQRVVQSSWQRVKELFFAITP